MDMNTQSTENQEKKVWQKPTLSILSTKNTLTGTSPIAYEGQTVMGPFGTVTGTVTPATS
jgi:hypothetical protein